MTQTSTSQTRLRLSKIWPLLVLGIGLVLFLVFDLDRYITLELLRENRQLLLERVADNAALTALVFILIYMVSVAFSLPGATVLSITGGFLFGPYLGTFYNVLAATLGATALFLAARTALADVLKDKAGPWLDKLADGFARNAMSYMLFLRLNPVFPFFVVNLVPAFLSVKLRTYFIGTFVGIIPGAFVYSYVGAGLGSIFDSGGELSISGLLTFEIKMAFGGLALLALMPVVVKWVKGRRAGA